MFSKKVIHWYMLYKQQNEWPSLMILNRQFKTASLHTVRKTGRKLSCLPIGNQRILQKKCFEDLLCDRHIFSKIGGFAKSLIQALAANK